MLVLIFLTIFVTCIISEPVDVPIGTFINDKYRVLEKIHDGSHATVYKVIEKTAIWTTDKIWAMKIQGTETFKCSLRKEYYHYNDILNCTKTMFKPRGLPLVREFNYYSRSCTDGKSYDVVFLILEYFENSPNPKGKQLSTWEAYEMIVQMIDILKYIHEKGSIHRNIKTENMMLRGGEIILIDFADAQRYPNQSRNTERFFGTSKFAPLRAHKFLNQDQECDLESLGYVGMIILGVPMPFDKTDVNYQKFNKFSISYIEKRSFRDKGIEQLNFKNGPISGLFATYFTYLNGLNFGDTPEYEKLRNIFENELKKMEKTKPESGLSKWICLG